MLKIDHSQISRITLIPEASKVTPESLRSYGRTVVADFYVEGIEKGEEIEGGYRLGLIDNVDHHAPTERMARFISSTPLASLYVSKYGIPEDRTIIIHHTDTDSVLSSGILARVIEPGMEVEVAAIAADHTGDEDPIADLLQSLEGTRDLHFSFRNLELLLTDKDLEPRAAELLESRKRLREIARDKVRSGAFVTDGLVTYCELPERVESDLFPALLPEAAVIFFSFPSKRYPGPGVREIKLRLGLNAPPTLRLNKMTLPNFGGRWNAGSSARTGGITMPTEEYVAILNREIEKQLT